LPRTSGFSIEIWLFFMTSAALHGESGT